VTKFRDTYIEDEKVLDDSGTVTIDIKIKDPITALEILMSAANGATSNQENHLHDCVSKIELVDGSDVLYSLSMVQGQALNFFEMGKEPIMNLTEFASDGARESVMINFGRFFGDEAWAFDPTRFKNPQLKITWNLAAIRAVGATGFVSGSGRLTIIAHIMEGATPPSGFLMSKEIYSWTTAASGDEKITMPTDYPYRLLLFRVYEAGMDMRENVSDLKLSGDQDKFIPFDHHMLRLMELNHTWFGKAHEHQKLYQAADRDLPIHINEITGLALTSESPGYILSTRWAWSSQLHTEVRLHDGTTPTAMQEFHADIEGYGFHNTVAWKYGDLQIPEKWFDAPSYGAIDLYATQANAGGAASVFVQQARKY